MNKRILLATGVTVLTLAAMGGLHQAYAISDTSDAEATIIQAITVDCSTSTLDFGNILPSGVAGVITVTTAGVGSGDANATYISGAAAGNCDVAGAALTADIDITNIQPVIGPGVDMTMSNFTLSYNGGGAAAAPIAPTLVPAGAALLIGAQLAVGANQVAGAYTGTFDVDVQYQ